MASYLNQYNPTRSARQASRMVRDASTYCTSASTMRNKASSSSSSSLLNAMGSPCICIGSESNSRGSGPNSYRFEGPHDQDITHEPMILYNKDRDSSASVPSTEMAFVPFQTPYDIPAAQELTPRIAHPRTPFNRMSTEPLEPSLDVNISGRRNQTSHGEDQVSALLRKVAELERLNDACKQQVIQLEVGLGCPITSAASHRNIGGSTTFGSSQIYEDPAPSSAFLQSWRARTKARIRLYCSLNRAGNALCSWHDSRRERRAYPPRLAPAGTLNCGCTFEEALFEETLARLGIGNYRPGGHSVRMDPALRNPLLLLLQRRYGYQDGDFERDTASGTWLGDEGHTLWEQRVTAAHLTSRHRDSTA